MLLKLCQSYHCFSYVYIVSIRTFAKNYFKCPLEQKGKIMDKLVQLSEKRFQKVSNPKGIYQTKRVNKNLIDSDKAEKLEISNRKNILNKAYFNAITLILATHQIGKNITKLQASITEVIVHKGYDSMSVYFSCRDEIIDEVLEELVRIKGDLHKLLAEHSIQNNLPQIHFIYDSHTLLISKLDEILEKADYGPNYKPKQLNEFTPPIPDPDPPTEKQPRISPHIWSLANFNEDYASSCKHNPYESVKKAPIFECPNDMKLDVLGINYKSLVNQIELNIRKSRASLKELNAVADPLPPLDWFHHIPRVSPNPKDPASHYEERIKAMKTFINLNKKKKQILARESRKLKWNKEDETDERLSWVKMKLDSLYESQDQELSKQLIEQIDENFVEEKND